MRPENQARLRRIELISRILRVVCMVFLGLIALGFLAAVWTLMGGEGLDPGGSIGSHLAVGGSMAVLAGLIFNCGYHLYRLLGNYSRGEIFTRDSAGQIRQWGIACVLWGCMRFALRFAPLALFPANYEAYTQPFQGLGMVVNGLIIVAISWFMEMAVEMREESELTV